MKSAFSLLFRHSGWITAGVIAIAVIIWSASLYSIAVQIDRPFPGFFYSPDLIVSGFTPRDFTGWQSGLRPWDRIIAVNRQNWREMPRLVGESGIGSILVYTVQRGDQRLQVAVPTMKFTSNILLRFIPGYLFFAVLCVAVGIFVYVRNPAGRLNLYLLLYLLCWSCGMGAMWESILAQHKWTTYLIQPWVGVICAAGWIFFWSFPADLDRKEFLAHWPLIPAFAALATAAIFYFPTTLFLTLRLDRPEWWRVYTLSASWGSFLVFGVGSLFNKTFPLFQIAFKKSTSLLIRQQALVLLVGIGLGLSGFMAFSWIPFSLHYAPAINTQWGILIASFYPLSVGYAVLRYQLFDIRVAFRKGLVYSLLTAALTAIFLILSLLIGYLFQGLTGQTSLFAVLIPALLIGFLFQPVRNHIQTFVDRAFFRREYEIRQTLAAFSRGLTTLREKNEVVRLVLDTAVGTLGAERASLWLLDDGQYQPEGVGPVKALSAECYLAMWLLQERRPLLVLPGDHSPQTDELSRIMASLAVPFLVGDKLVGILTLGEKRSGDLYNQDDLDLIMTLAHSATLALENARLHEERVAILRQRLAQVTAAQEEERGRIARELHDGVGPALASLNVGLHTARKLLQRDHNLADEELEELAELVQDNIQDIRRLVYDLRPIALDELGLVPALHEYIARYKKEHDLEVIQFLPEDNRRLPAPLETTLLRVAQEALTNVAKHAMARQVEITFKWENRGVSLCIVDDGQGFDPQQVFARARQGGHLGLWSMRERIEQLGGQFQVHSAPGQGTAIAVRIPIEDEAMYT